MGNYCCSDQAGTDIKRKAKKISLENPEVKIKYEESIGEALNDVMQRFKGERKVKSIKIKSRLGKGGQGDVFLVEVHSFGKGDEQEVKNYAMKRVSKKKLDAKRTRQALVLENQILSQYHCKFILQINYAFQNSTQLFYLMDIAKGGDLYSYISDTKGKANPKAQLMKKKGESAIRFILAGVVLGLEYLHHRGIIYRDLKPENILLFEDGYPRLADFGVAQKYVEGEKCYDIKGTVLYFCPEMTSKKGYDKSIDFWALGILLHEMLYKRPPFSSQEIKSRAFQGCMENSEKSPLRKKKPSSGLDLLKRLLVTEPTERIGYNSMQEIKDHQFFDCLDWEKYEKKQLKSPFKDIIDLEEQQRRTEVLEQQVETQTRSDIPINFMRGESNTRGTVDEMTTMRSLRRGSFIINQGKVLELC